jgi:ABC-type transport system involved in multi-copper enzyme maturation permease subunit
MLTIPVDEVSLVLSKFFATLIFFLLTWVPWGLFLIALRIEGGQSFDYLPVLSFLVALICSGAGFIAMGMLFSSITRNQIIAAILTLAGMFVLLFIYFAVHAILREPNPWIPVLRHMSFVDLWETSLEGKLQPQFLLFHISAAIFWLFLTVKVLEARRWA